MLRALKVTVLLALFVLLANQKSSAQGRTLMDAIIQDATLGQMTNAIRAAGLEQMLRGPGPYTVFAPVNGAFSDTGNGGKMREVVLYHTINGNYSHDALKGMPNAQSALGPDLYFSNDRGLTINGEAKMVSINISASNGTLHLIHRVVEPQGGTPAGGNGAAAPANNAGAENAEEAAPPEPQTAAIPDPGASNMSDPQQNPAFVSGGLMPYWSGVTAESNSCKGMTWVLHKDFNNISLVGADRKTNPYRGDTNCGAALPVLCFYRDLQSRPAGQFPEGWSYGTVKATKPIQGYELSSLEAANNICREAYGDRYRIAEYHDSEIGRSTGHISGHNFWARGNVPAGTRFWVRINDQPANPWDSVVSRGGGPIGGGPRIENPGDDPAFVGNGPAWMSRAQGGGKSGCAGMTWVVYRQMDGRVQVGTDQRTNPFVGDLACGAVAPVLCIKVDGLPVPASTSGQNYSFGWSGGTVAATHAVSGDQISTREAATSLCRSVYGNGWRMAEFHDGALGNGVNGWAFWAYGSLPSGQRYWVANNDQRANVWNR